MRTIETTVTISEDGELTARAPAGAYRAVLVIEDAAAPPAVRSRLQFGRYPFGLTSDQDTIRRENLYDDGNLAIQASPDIPQANTT